jgi:phage/plasmid-associated DNA primase
MLDVIGSIIGKAHYITSSNPKDFFGDYAEGFYRKILVNINECEGKDTFDYEGKIKSFITENSITLNPKFVRQTTISNYARLIIFTNKPNPIPIDVRSKDRRFVVYQSTDKYLDKKYGTTFWEKLIKYFQNPKFIACLYDDLNNIKLDGIKWKESRPITKAYLEMCKLYIPTEALFLEDFIDNKKYNNNNNSNLDLDDDEDFIDNLNNSVDVSTTDLYKQYTEFCKKYGYINDNSYQPNITKFNGRLQELDLQIIRQKTSETTIFRFTPKTVYKIMEERKWIIKKETEINEDELKDIGGEDFDNYFVEL